MKKFIHAPCENNFNTVVEEHISSENIHFDIACCRLGIRYAINSPLQTVKQIEFLQEVALAKVSKLNCLCNERKYNNFFLGKKALLRKIKMKLSYIRHSQMD